MSLRQQRTSRGTVANASPGTDTRPASGTSMSPASETGTKPASGTGTGTNSARKTDTRPASGTGAGTKPASETGTNSARKTDTKPASGTGTGTKPVSGIGAKPMSGTSTNSASGTATLSPSSFERDSRLGNGNGHPEPILMRFVNKSTRALVNMKNELGYGAQAMAVASMDTPSYMIDEFIDMTDEVSSRDDSYRKACVNASPDDILSKLLDDFRAVVERRFADKIIDRLAYGFENVDGLLVLNARNATVDEIVLTPLDTKLSDDEKENPDPFATGVIDVPISHATFSLRYHIPISSVTKQFPDLSQYADIPRLGIQKCEVLRLVGTECGRIEFHLRDENGAVKLEAATIWCI